MRGLDPAHPRLEVSIKDVDGRDKPGHDDKEGPDLFPSVLFLLSRLRDGNANQRGPAALKRWLSLCQMPG
jgi:hypothetical protein